MQGRPDIVRFSTFPKGRSSQCRFPSSRSRTASSSKSIEAEKTTASGLVIPDTAKEKPQEGEVLAVGPGRIDDGQPCPIDVTVGDRVIYSKYGGTEIKHGGEGVPHPLRPRHPRRGRLRPVRTAAAT